MKEPKRESEVRAYQNRAGETPEDTSLPRDGRPKKVDYQVYGRAFQWCPGGSPRESFSSATCMVEFQAGKTIEKYWSKDSVYIQPQALELVSAPIVKHVGRGFLYGKTQLTSLMGNDIVKTWSRMRENLANCTCADDLHSALETQAHQHLYAEQWEQRAQIAIMLDDLIRELGVLFEGSDFVWILGL